MKLCLIMLMLTIGCASSPRKSETIHRNEYVELLRFDYVIFKKEESKKSNKSILYKDCFRYPENEGHLEVSLNKYFEIHDEEIYQNFEVYKIHQLFDYCIIIEGIK